MHCRQTRRGRVGIAVAILTLACGLVTGCNSAGNVALRGTPPPPREHQGEGDDGEDPAEWTEGGQVATEVEGAEAETAAADASAGAGDGGDAEPQAAAPDVVGASAVEEAAEAAPPATGSGEEAGADEVAIEGSLNTRYVGRTAGGDHDQDIYTLLGATIGDPEKDPYSGYILGRLSQDLDGDQGEEDSPFFSLEDTYDHSLNGHLYEAYVDFHDTGLDLLRAGRQTFYDTPAYVRFDGASLAARPGEDDSAELGAYGGRTVHEYESSPEGDAVYGAWVSEALWTGGRGRIDYMHLEDEQQLGDEQNDLWAAQIRQAVDRDLQLKSGYSWLEGAPREFDARATWLPYETGWLVQGSYYALLQTEGSLAEELDPFFDTLQEYFPFSLSRLLVSKTFEEGYVIEGGADVRRVDDSEDEGEFNRDYERYHLTGTVEDFAIDDLTLALTGDYWTADGSDTNSFGMDLTQQMSEELRASIGSYYQLYKNDFLLDEEREDVRTYYVSVRWRPEQRLTWGLGFEHEDSDVDDINTLTARSIWNF